LSSRRRRGPDRDPSADAAIPQVFTKTATPLTCTVQAERPALLRGQITSWDGIPLDVNVGFPPEAGTDANWPVIGIYHGWGGSKLALTASDASARSPRLRVFSDDRPRLGPLRASRAPAGCVDKGYIHLMHNAYEVRDAQYLLGLLADDGAIDPQKIGATGGSYGGGMSIALGALRNRVRTRRHARRRGRAQLGKPMQIAATAPEFTWSDLDTR
jgi:hypothetical protein